MKNIFLKFIPIVIIALCSWFGFNHFSKSKDGENENKRTQQQKEKKAARKRTAQQTTADILTRVNYPIELTTQGVVKTKVSTTLNPLVQSRIIKISPKFQDGAFFQKGETLVELATEEFEAQIIAAKANVARAEAALIQEKATAAQALRNWQDIGFDEEPNDLVLRKPQLREAEANLAAQMASLAGAKLNLERTKIKAPINGRVRTRFVGPGQSVSANTNLGEIYATDSAEIRLPLSSTQLEKITINEQGNQSIPVILTDAINSNNKTKWKATVKYVEGELDEASRELFVIAHIQDPFGIESNSPPLRINQPVKASIMGHTLKDAFIINRKHLYGANEIILIENDAIQRTKINIVWTTSDSVITLDSHLAGKTIATSRLGFATNGSAVEIITPEGLHPENLEVNKDVKKLAPSNKSSSKRKSSGS